MVQKQIVARMAWQDLKAKQHRRKSLKSTGPIHIMPCYTTHTKPFLIVPCLFVMACPIEMQHTKGTRAYQIPDEKSMAITCGGAEQPAYKHSTTETVLEKKNVTLLVREIHRCHTQLPRRTARVEPSRMSVTNLPYLWAGTTCANSGDNWHA